MSDKTKCPVFGCTIPRGIPHEHPAGVSAVMRDPAEPLNAFERGELDAYRRMNRIQSHAEERKRQQASFLQVQSMQNSWGLGQNTQPGAQEQLMHHRQKEAMLQVAMYCAEPIPNVYVVPSDSNIHVGRKLRDALLEAGTLPAADLFGARDMQNPTGDKAVDLVFTPPKRRTLAQSIGLFMAGMFSIPALALAAFAIGEYFGWWV